MRRAVIAALAVIAAAAASAPPAAADEGWTITQFTADISIQKDSSLHIVETISVDFGGLQRHGIIREIPVRYRYDDTHLRVYRLDVRSVTDGDHHPLTYTTSDVGADRVIKIGDADKLVSGARSYRITYDVAGAMNAFDDHEELFWNVNGTWSVPTRSVTANVQAAGGITRTACYQGRGGSRDACRAVGGANGASFTTTQPLASGEQLTIVVALAKGTVTEPRVLLERDTENIATYFETNAVFLAVAVFVLVAGLALFFWRWYSAGREPAEPAVVPEYEPPDGLRPAHVGLLLDESADTKDLTATIVDLAVRGYLRIMETGGSGLFAKKDWTLTKSAKAPSDLLSYERTVYDGLFVGRDEVRISELRQHFVETLKDAEGQLYDDSLDRGWFDRRPDTTRRLYAGLGVLLAVAGAALAWLLGRSVGGGLVGVALALVGLLAVPFARAMPARTKTGADLLWKIRGFRRYMDVAEADRARFAERENIFSAYLPYAIVFGCVERWARAFAGIDTAAQTAGWYAGSGSFNAPALSSSLQGFSSDLGSAISATAGSSGGSGFAGGGAGGGGGGGGGGSW